MKSRKNDIIIKLLVRHIKSEKNLYTTFDHSSVHQKYSLESYIIEILYVLKTGISWRDIRSTINWNSIYKTYIKLNKYKIFQIVYIDLFKKYIEKSPNKKLRFVLTDTTFIPNKKGIDLIGYNKYYNKKNGTKLSLITGVNGHPFNVKCYKEYNSDSKILIDQLKIDNLVSLDHIGVYKEYFLADPGYDSIEIRKKLKSMK